jgi:hypothetical protein
MYYDQVNDIYLVSKMGQILKVILKEIIVEIFD